ncbi:MAG: YbaN family protein [Ndongobacter sp.]|nr:YbaN family protein [Ndongobacter sp.]
MKLKRFVYAIIGWVSLGLGVVGLCLPVLPTVPFFLLTAYCFTKSSVRLHDWFVGTKMYRKHIEGFVRKKGMTRTAKLWTLSTLTLVFGAGFFAMHRLGAIRWIVFAVWVCHVLYFLFRVPTRRAPEPVEGGSE